MPAAIVAALLAAALTAPAASAQLPSSVPAGWGSASDQRGDDRGDWGGWADDEDDPAEEPSDDSADESSDDPADTAGGWIDGDELLPPTTGEAPGAELLPPPGKRPVVKGRLAALGQNGIGYAPSKAPQRVKLVIWAANQLRSKPYKWGGGHGRWQDSGYDCSGSVSFALHAAGLLGTPLDSTHFTRYGKTGLGKWISIYANKGHVFMVVAGLRFDTSAMGAGDKGPRWRGFGRRAGGFKVRHPAGL